MTVQTSLFGSEKDWLAHTLARAHVEAPAMHGPLQLPDGGRIEYKDLGVLYCLPPESASAPPEALIVSAGIHGNETAPVEVLNGLVNEYLAGQWRLACPLLLILGNPPAMVAGERFCRINLNRLFSGAHQQVKYAGQAEAARARRLEALCSEFAARHPGPLSHYDLHTAIRPSQREKFALYPYVGGRRPSLDQCDFLREAGIGTLLLQHKHASTFSAFTANTLRAESFTLELGKVRPFGENDLSRFSAAGKALRRRFVGAAPPDTRESTRLDIFEVVHEIINTGPTFRFHVPDHVPNFTVYEPGAVIWEDDKTCYQVGDMPQAIVFPNPTVPVGQRVGLMVRGVGAF